jgi:hypothetical protein
LGQVRVGAELLPEPNKNEGLNQPVEVSSHRLALLGRENPLARWHCGRQASHVFRQRKP